MSSDPQAEAIDFALARRTWAVVGLSPDPRRDSHRIAALLQRRGHRVVPVNPHVEEVLGERAYASLADVPPEAGVEVVDVFRRSRAAGAHVDEAIAAGRVRCGCSSASSTRRRRPRPRRRAGRGHGPLPGDRARAPRRGGAGRQRDAARVIASTSSSASASAAARAESWIVSGRREPGIGMTVGPRCSSHASTTCWGETPRSSRDRGHRVARGRLVGLADAPQRRPGQEGDPVLGRGPHLALRQRRGEVERELVLHGDDVDDRARLLELLHGDVRQPDPADLALVLEVLERPDGLRERHVGVRAVVLVEVDPVGAQRAQRGLAGRAQVGRRAVELPRRAAARVAALGGHEDAVAAGGRAPDRLGDEALVVADLGLVRRVGVGGVDEGDPGVERGVDGPDGLCLVGSPGDGERHAAQADREDVDLGQAARGGAGGGAHRDGLPGRPPARTVASHPMSRISLIPLYAHRGARPVPARLRAARRARGGRALHRGGARRHLDRPARSGLLLPRRGQPRPSRGSCSPTASASRPSSARSARGARRRRLGRLAGARATASATTASPRSCSWARWRAGVLLASDVFHSGANVETLLFGSLLVIAPGDSGSPPPSSAVRPGRHRALGRAGWRPGSTRPRRARSASARRCPTRCCSSWSRSWPSPRCRPSAPCSPPRCSSCRPRRRGSSDARLRPHGSPRRSRSSSSRASPGCGCRSRPTRRPGRRSRCSPAPCSRSSAARAGAAARRRLAAAALRRRPSPRSRSCGCGAARRVRGGGPLAVVATTTQLGDFARAVGGDARRRHPDPRAEHGPARVRAAARATSGDGAARRSCWRTATGSTRGWARSSSRRRRPAVVDVGAAAAGAPAGRAGGPEASRYDPHWWHDPRQRGGRRRADPRRADARPTRRTAPTLRAQRGAPTCARLRALDAGIAAASPRCRPRSASWSPTTTPSATSPAATGSQRRRRRDPVADDAGAAVGGRAGRLARVIRRERVKAVFPESVGQPAARAGDRARRRAPPRDYDALRRRARARRARGARRTSAMEAGQRRRDGARVHRRAAGCPIAGL